MLARRARACVDAGLAAAGYLTPETSLWREGRPEWQRLEDITDLALVLSAAQDSAAAAAAAVAAAAAKAAAKKG